MSGTSDNPEALHERALRAAQQGQLDNARTLLEQAISVQPAEPAYHSNLGSVLQSMGDFDAAACAHERAIELSAQRLAMHCYNLGTVLGAQGKLAEAAAAYRRALAHMPGFAQAHDNLGTVLQHQGKLAEAEAAYRRALELAPEQAWTYRNLGSVLCAAGRYGDAETAYDQALALQPDTIELHLDLGMALRLQGRTDDAEAVYRHVLSLDANNGHAHELLGTVLLGAGKAKDAEVAHRRATELLPDSADAHNALGATLASQGLLEQAVGAFRRALQLRPDWVQAHYNLGVVLHNLGDLDAALVAYQSVLGHAPGHVDAHKNLAEVLRRLGRFDQAMDAYQLVLERDPGNVAVQHMLAALRGDAPARAPAAYVQQTFDGYASYFDEHLVDQLDYRVPELMRRVMDDLAPGRRFAAGLDLGCGTGLVGARFRDLVDELHGVDLSEKMIARARGKGGEQGLYDRLHQADLVAFVGAATTRYDLFMAGDVLIYLGDLSELFAAISAALQPGGLFVFTIEELGDDAAGGDYRLRATGRFAHSRVYLAELARKHDFTMVHQQSADLRREHDAPVPGILAVLTR